MDLGLRDKVAVVSGGSAGVGFATAALLLEEGARVAVFARDQTRLDAATERLQSRGEVHVSAIDVVDGPAVHAFVEEVGDRFGGVDVLVNNAGGGRWSTFASTSDEDWKAELELKFFGMLHPVRAVVPSMRARGGGAIVNVNAIAAREPLSHLVATSAARAGLLNLSRSLANELAPDGIRVNSVLLGMILTEQWVRRHQERAPEMTLDEYESSIVSDREVPLARFGRAEEVAAAIVFLCSVSAGYITGATLDIGGGVHRYV